MSITQHTLKDFMSKSSQIRSYRPLEKPVSSIGKEFVIDCHLSHVHWLTTMTNTSTAKDRKMWQQLLDQYNAKMKTVENTFRQIWKDFGGDDLTRASVRAMDVDFGDNPNFWKCYKGSIDTYMDACNGGKMTDSYETFWIRILANLCQKETANTIQASVKKNCSANIIS